MARLFLVQLVVIVLLLLLATPNYIMPLLEPLWLKPFEETLQRKRAGGVAQILAGRLNKLPDDKQYTLIEKLQTQFPYVIDIRELSHVTLNLRKLEQLHQGQLVIDRKNNNLYKLLNNNIRVLVIENAENQSEYALSNTQIEALGTIALLEQELIPFPPTQWKTIFSQKAQLFSYPLKLQVLSELSINVEDIQKLEQGKIVTRKVDPSLEYGSGLDYFYKKIPESDWVICAGPITIPTTEILTHAIRVSFSLLGILIAIPLIIWLTPTWRSMKHLAKATKAFGVGDFSARAKLIRASQLNEQARVFNQMAEKTQDLFSSNKMLTHAVSQELQLPLNYIERNLQQLKNATSEDVIDKLSLAIEKSVDEMRDLTSSILLYARLDREKSELSVESVDLNKWVGENFDQWLAFESEFKNIPVFMSGYESKKISIYPQYLTLAMKNVCLELFGKTGSKVVIRTKVRDGQGVIELQSDRSETSEESTDWFPAFKEGEPMQLRFAISRKIIDWHGATLSFSGDTHTNRVSIAFSDKSLFD